MSKTFINGYKFKIYPNKKILTENRLSTVNKRETSYEGLSA